MVVPLYATPKAQSTKGITDKLNSMKIKISALWKTISIEWEDKSQTGRKYVQEIYIIKDCYPKYTKKFKTQN